MMTWAAILALSLAALGGARVYVQDQRDALERTEVVRCEQRVELRDQLRAVFLSLFELIDRQSGGRSEFVVEATALLDAEYPPLPIEACANPLPPED